MKTLIWIGLILLTIPSTAFSHFADALEDEENLALDMETFMAPGSAIVVRVGSPFYNALRNTIRNDRTNGREISDAQFALLHAEEVQGAGPNTLLVLRYDKNKNAETLKKGVHQKPDPRKNWHLYLHDQKLGARELVVENGILYMVTLPLAYATGAPVYEVINSIKDPGIFSRFQNSGLAIIDTAKGTVAAATDIVDKFSEADFIRALKAGLRLPFSVFQLGATVATKVVRLPFDLLMAVFNGLEKVTTLPVYSRTFRLWFKIIENNDYDVEIQIKGEKILGAAAFKNTGKGRLALENTSDVHSFSWIAMDEEGQTTESVLLGKFSYKGQMYSFIAKVDGTFDITIEGYLLKRDLKINEYNLLWLAKNPEYVRNNHIGTIHFDD